MCLRYPVLQHKEGALADFYTRRTSPHFAEFCVRMWWRNQQLILVVGWLHVPLHAKFSRALSLLSTYRSASSELVNMFGPECFSIVDSLVLYIRVQSQASRW